jgi:hypothetical protein
MKRLILLVSFVICWTSASFADIPCTPTQPLPQQNRTHMKHRIPPTQRPVPVLTTVAAMAAASPATGVTTPGFRTADRPIDQHELGIVTLKGDLWAINVEANDCDFHLEISDVGNSVSDDRVIVEIPQGPPFVVARDALIQLLRASGITFRRRMQLNPPIRVQVLGYAFYDAWHFSPNNPQRGHGHGSPQVASIWEIHPVWALIAAQ